MKGLVSAKTSPAHSKPPQRKASRVRAPHGQRGRGWDEAPDVSLTEQAYRALEELITTLALPPGTVLGEQSLAQRLQIGRTPIREALQRLSRDGLVVVLPRRGILVSDINIGTHLRLIETRRVLEQLIARLAAERATADDRTRFTLIAGLMRTAAESADDIAFMRLDREFNELIGQTARNEYALRALNSMSALSRRFWYQNYQQASDLALTANLHADVCEAVARRDPKMAAEASDRLIDYIEAFARNTLG